MFSMATIPTTSISMLKSISGDATSVRWTEFVRKYEEPMRGFLHARFPTVEAEDAIQETLIALMNVLPNYHYTPDENGHFRNYLMGILSHKASDILARNAKQSKLRTRLKDEMGNGLRIGTTSNVGGASGYSPMQTPDEYGPKDDEAWKMSVMEVAVEQLMSDDRIRPVTREVFRHVALMHESPEEVAEAFGISRNNVDQIKNRMIGKLTEQIRAMMAEVR